MPDRNGPVTSVVRTLAGWRMHLHGAGIVLAMVISLIVVSIVLATRSPESAEPPLEPLVQFQATPPVTIPAPATATPDAELVHPEGSLPALLTLAPDQIDDDENGLPVEATYANLEGWLAHSGVDADDLPADELVTQLHPLEFPEVLESRGLSAEWRDVYGFDLRQVDQVLAVGHAPNQILIMPGRYDVDELYARWVRSGYQAVEVEERTVWSLFPGDRIDLSAPASRPALGMLNNVILLDDGTLIATARQSRMAEVLRVVNGDAASLLDRDSLHGAIDSLEQPSPLTAVIANGRLLHQTSTAGTNPTAEASPAAGGTPAAIDMPLPEVDLVLFGWSPAEDGRASIAMTMLYEDAPDDIERLPHVLEQRVREDDTWSGQYALASIEVVGDDSDMIEVRFSPADSENAGLDLVEDQELDPFMWSSSS